MVGRPAIVLADEPTGNLDAENGEEVMGLMKSLVENGATMIMVTHSETQASMADRVVAMRDGTVC
jgi:putative ABC transport system ATP-binding protein